MKQMSDRPSSMGSTMDGVLIRWRARFATYWDSANIHIKYVGVSPSCGDGDGRTLSGRHWAVCGLGLRLVSGVGSWVLGVVSWRGELPVGSIFIRVMMMTMVMTMVMMMVMMMMRHRHDGEKVDGGS